MLTEKIALNKNQKRVINAITFGNILEWYQAYSYVYLTPILGKIFFNFHSPENNLFMGFIVFGIGFLIRPLSGLVMGCWGDLKGRKSPFVWSIFIMTLASFAIGCLPTYASWGIWAPITLILLRFIQSFSESGEYIGAACFLYENANPQNRTFMASFAALGNQIGAILAIFEVLILDQFMSIEFQFKDGWRIPFWTGGIIGLVGLYLRKSLSETPVFQELKSRFEVSPNKYFDVMKNQKKKIFTGFSFCLVNAATFYLIAAYLPTYLNETLGLTTKSNAIISLTLLGLMTILLPVFGILGSAFRHKTLLIVSTFTIIGLLFPLYLAIDSKNIILVFTLIYLYVIPIACISALLGSVTLHLFSASIRYTGVGLAFNFADSFIGRFTPAIALLLVKITHNEASFCWFILACSIISLISYLKIKNDL